MMPMGLEWLKEWPGCGGGDVGGGQGVDVVRLSFEVVEGLVLKLKPHQNSKATPKQPFLSS